MFKLTIQNKISNDIFELFQKVLYNIASLLLYDANCLHCLLSMSSQNVVVVLQRLEYICTLYVVIERSCCIATSFVCVLSVSLYNVVVMLQRHLSVYILCRHRTSLLCYSVICLCTFFVVIERRCYVTASFLFVLYMSLQNVVFVLNGICLGSVCVVKERRCYVTASFVCVFQCRYITSLLRYSVLSVFYLCRHTTSYVTTSFVCVLSVSLYNVVVMLQSHLSVFFLCRHRTSLLCYSGMCLCSLCVVI